MKKVLIIIPDNNKGKFISKGFAKTFNQFSFFVYEMKTYDLNVSKINNISPDVIFIFWSDIRNNNLLETLLFRQESNVLIPPSPALPLEGGGLGGGEKNYPELIAGVANNISCNSKFIHCSEFIENIPKKFHKLKSHYIFTPTSKHKYIPSVSNDDYETIFQGYKHKISFAGNPAYENREIILAELIKNFGVISIFSRSYDFYKSVEDITNKKLLEDYEIELYRKSYKGYVNSTKELADIYVSSIVNLDIENKKDINYRLLEITMSGGFVITSYNKNIINYYDDGKEIETYTNKYELIDKINFYLKNRDMSKNIALNGKENTVKNFSYEDSLQKILKVVYGKNFSNR